MSELVGFELPLFLVFVVILAGVWAWISFGPHPPTPADNWVRIENTWLPKLTADNKQVAATTTDFTAQIAAYKAVQNDIQGWVADLGKVATWEDPNASIDPNATSPTPNGDLVSAFVNAADTEVADLDTVIAAASPAAVNAMSAVIRTDESGFDSAFAAARLKIVGKALPAEPTLAMPSLPVCASPSAAASGSPSASVTPSPSASPSASRSPGASGSAVSSASAGASGSGGSSASPGASGSPGASATPLNCLEVSPSGSPGASGSPTAGGSAGPTETPAVTSPATASP